MSPRLQARPGASEAFGRVATTALWSEFTAVHVVGAMTGDTSAGLTYAVARWPRVARFALQPDMRAGQIEIGLCVVIEAPIRPAHRAVTGGAILAEPPFVAIIVAVAFHALGGRVFEPRRRVARGASDADMLANQGKNSKSVIKTN